MTDFLGRLLADLNAEGGTARRVPQGLVAERRDDVDLDPPVTITADDEALAEYLASAGKAAQRLWPGDTPAQAAWRLLLTNLDEALAVGATQVRVEGGSVSWSGQPPLPALPQDGGDYVWSAYPGTR